MDIVHQTSCSTCTVRGTVFLTWSDDDALLSRPVQVPVEVVVLEGVEGHVEHLEEVASLRGGDAGLGDFLPQRLRERERTGLMY